eukprot:PhM_4_TR13208/c0_g1_i1/m.53123
MPIKPMKPVYGDDNFATTLVSPFGFESQRRYNIQYLDNNTLLCIAGNLLQFINLATGQTQSITGRDMGGFGAICVHPNREHFVACETAPANPLVLVYDYPGREVKVSMRGGATMGFTSAAFNKNGDKLVTVAMEPDYLITIWNWREGTTVLRNKASGSDVYSVSFNPLNEGILTTCGMGHIKFWTMANTFTGLKLQGQTGKFGRVDISDVVGHVNLPDGKVLSGSETGMLLLWEGNLIKCEIGRQGPGRESERLPCHDGAVEVLLFLEGKMFLSAGFDGFIRYWGLPAVDTAESTDADSCCQIPFLREVFLGPNVQVKAITLSPNNDHWVVQDANGQLLRVPYLSFEDMGDAPLGVDKQPVKTPIQSFHAGAITCVDTSPNDHMCVTGGEDGTVRLFDYLRKKEIYRYSFNAAVSVLRFFPKSVEPSGHVMYAGFDNGCVRVLRRTIDGFELVSVCKPHVSKITSIAFDRGFGNMVTASEDKTLFFFTVDDPTRPFKPRCFVTLFEVPTSVTYTKDATHILVGLTSGNVIRVQIPTTPASDASFECELKYDGWGFRRFMRKPEKKAKPKPEAGADAVPLVGVEKPADEDDEDEDEDELIDYGPWPINFLEALDDRFGNTVIVGMRNPESCFEYFPNKWYPDTLKTPVDKYGQELPNTLDEPVRNLAWKDAVTSSCFISKSEKYLLMGCEHGRILVRPLVDIEKCYLGQQLHSGLHGVITAVCTSYEDTLLLSAGRDGMMFVQSLLDQPVPNQFADVKTLPVRSSEVTHDIEDVDALSIHQQRLKDDADAIRNNAESKKQTLRDRVAHLQAEFETLLVENDNAPLGKKLPAEDLMLDPVLIEEVKKDNDKRIEEARMEYAWVCRKKEVAVKKLHDLTWGSIAQQRVVLHAFASNQSVATFRTPHFTERQRKYIDSVHELVEREKARKLQQARENEEDDDDADEEEDEFLRDEHQDPEDTTTRSMTIGQSTAHLAAGNNNDAASGLGGTSADLMTSTMLKTTRKPAVKSQLEKTEERRRERAQRQAGRDELERRKPRDDQEDPKDAAAIQRARDFMGDYKLKNDPKYEVPVREQANAERKTRQLILLEESLNTLRMDFNERFLAVRELKKRFIQKINNDRARIQQINKQLGIDEPMVTLALRPEEEPEKRLDISHDQLKVFEQEMIRQQQLQEARDRQARGGFGIQGGMDDDEEAEGGHPQAAANMARRLSHRASLRRGSMSILSAKERLELEMKHRMDGITQSDLEVEEKALERQVLQYEKARLERKISKTISAFDDALASLRLEKLKMEADLKMADMRVLLLFKELQLLNEFKKKDMELTKKVEDKRHEKNTILAQTQACLDKLNEKFPEAEQMDKRGNEVLERCKALILDHPAQTILWKIFKRKIKRRRKTDQEEEEDEDESSSSDEDDWVEEDDDDDGLPEEETCPDNCDEDTYYAILDLREERLDQEDMYADFQSSMQQLKKENTQLAQKQKAVETDLAKIEAEILAFQNEKQKQLNQLETIVVLKARQIQCLTERGRLPRDESHNVVFTKTGLRGLRQRIIDLGLEKQRLRKSFNDLRREEIKLASVQRKLNTLVSDWEAKVGELQLLKFGQKVDLDKLENVSVDRETENLKLRLKAEELRWERELGKVALGVEEARRAYQDIVNSNTKLLAELGSTREQQQEIESELNVSSNKVVTRMSGGSAVATEADRSHLKQLVVVQQSEIDALKNEIAMLRRKGGHVYTPVIHKDSGST